MPVSIVVGGQYGSEGKGKVAACLASEMKAAAVIRCGGSNSGHTVYDESGKKFIFRQIPTASIQPSILCILASGTYLDIDILLEEIALAKLETSRLKIDPYAVVIQNSHKIEEDVSGLIKAIGSTGSGTGAAVRQRLKRSDNIVFAKDIPELSKFIAPTVDLIHNILVKNGRIIIEGTQGFGLSILHSPFYPFVTSRDTTASGFISECGVSPLDVDDIVLVIRSFPIRVSGNSGPLEHEMDWNEIAKEAEANDLEEFTSVSKKLRRVGKFETDIVKQAIKTNRPTRVILNHLDHIKSDDRNNFISWVESQIDFKIEGIGTSPRGLKWLGKEKMHPAIYHAG